MPSSDRSITRRSLLKVGCAALAGTAAAPLIGGCGSGLRHVVRMRSEPTGARVWFDPLGLMVDPGDTVRWVIDANVHTTTAYHPSNANHALRIPEAAAAWDSGVLTEKDQYFDLRLTVEGVYDYFCAPHEAAGMVGRIVVGRPGDGPGTRRFDYFKTDPKAAAWRRVPEAARKTFPAVERIVADGVVRPPFGG